MSGLKIKKLEKARAASSKVQTSPKLSEQQIADLFSGKMKGAVSLTAGENHFFDPSLSARENHTNLKGEIAKLLSKEKYSDALALAERAEFIFSNYAKMAEKAGNTPVSNEYGQRTKLWTDFKTAISQAIANTKKELTETTEPKTSVNPEDQLHADAKFHREFIESIQNQEPDEENDERTLRLRAADHAHSVANEFIDKTLNLKIPEQHREIAKKYAQEFLQMAEANAPVGQGEEALWAQNPLNPDHPLHQERMAWEQLSQRDKKKTPMPMHERAHALDYPPGLEISRPDTITTQISPRNVDKSVIELYSKILTGKEGVFLSPQEIQQKIEEYKVSDPSLAARIERANLNNLFSKDKNFTENHFNETNKKRAEQGLPPLKTHEHLSDFKSLKWIINNPIAEQRDEKVEAEEKSGLPGLRERHPIAEDISNRYINDHFNTDTLELAEIIAGAHHKSEVQKIKITNAQRAKRGLAPLPLPKPVNVLQAAVDVVTPNSKPGQPTDVPKQPDFMNPGKRRNDPKLQLQYQAYREKTAEGNYYNPVQSHSPVSDTSEVRAGLEEGSKQYFDPKNNPRKAAAKAAADLHRRGLNIRAAGQHTIIGDKTPSQEKTAPTVPSATQLPSRGIDTSITKLPSREAGAPEKNPIAAADKRAQAGRKIERILSSNQPLEGAPNVPDYEIENGRINTSGVAEQIKTAAKKGKKPKSTQTEKSMQKSAEQAKNPSFLEKRREGATAQPPKEEEVVGNYSEHMKEQKTINDKPLAKQGFGSVTKLKAMVAKLKSK